MCWTSETWEETFAITVNLCYSILVLIFCYCFKSYQMQVPFLDLFSVWIYPQGVNARCLTCTFLSIGMPPIWKVSVSKSRCGTKSLRGERLQIYDLLSNTVLQPCVNSLRNSEVFIAARSSMTPFLLGQERLQRPTAGSFVACCGF